jgi:hypothetical protein
MKRASISVFLFSTAALCILLLSSCAAIPESSPISKIKYGMSRGEVIDVLNAPDAVKQISTWRKTFLPWKSNNDYRTVYYYNGLGKISFNRIGKERVQNISYNPDETGSNDYPAGLD